MSSESCEVIALPERIRSATPPDDQAGEDLVRQFLALLAEILAKE